MLLPVRFFSIYKAADLGCLPTNGEVSHIMLLTDEQRLLAKLFEFG